MPISGFKDENGNTHWTAVCNRCLRVGPPRLDREEALRAAGIGPMPNTHQSYQCVRGCEPRVVDPEVEPNAPCPSCGYHLDRAAVLNDEAPYVPFEACPRCGAIEEPPEPGPDPADKQVIDKIPFPQQVEYERRAIRHEYLGSVWVPPSPTDGRAVVTEIEAQFSDDGAAANFMVHLLWEGTRSEARVLIETLTEEWTQVVPGTNQDVGQDAMRGQVLHDMLADQHEGQDARIRRIAEQVRRTLQNTEWRHRERGIVGLVTDFHIPEDDPGEMTVTLIPQDIRDPIEEGNITITIGDLQGYWEPLGNEDSDGPMLEAEDMMMAESSEDSDFTLMAGSRRVGAMMDRFFEYDYGDVQGTMVLDWHSGQAQHLTLIGNLELDFANLPGGIAQMVLRVEQDWAGGNEIRWPSIVQRPSSSVCNGPPGSTTLFPLYCAGNGLVFMQEPIRYPYQAPAEVPQVERGIYRLHSDPGFHALVNYSSGGYHNAHIMGSSPNTPNALLLRYFRHIDDPRDLTGAWCRADRTSERVHIVEYDENRSRFIAEDGRGTHQQFHVIDFLKDYRRVGGMDEEYRLLHNPAIR